MINSNLKEKSKYTKLVNFSNNLNLPIHDWFNLKEGYSSELVENLIKDLKIKKGTIFDPFSGCGTTSLTAKKNGFSFIGFEVNPFLYTLAKTKTTNYNKKTKEKIKRYKSIIVNRVKNIKKVEQVNLSISKKVFMKQLNIILKYRQVILNIKDAEVKNFFLIAFLSILEKCGSAKKDGNGLRYPKNKKIFDFVEEFDKKVKKMIIDIESQNNFTKKNEIIYGDSRNIGKSILDKYKGSAKLSVFSPPYLNCFDYAEIYKIELWFGNFVKEYVDMKDIRNSSLTSHLNKNIVKCENIAVLNKYLNEIKKEKMWSNKIPNMITNYFHDMKDVLNNVYQLLDKNSYCVIIVGNSAYGKVVIPTDELLAKIGESLGFKIVKIEMARKLSTSPQQQKKIKDKNKLRESLIYLKKC